MSKIYVLVGHDHNGSFKVDMSAWQKRATEKGDVVFIRAKSNQSMEDAMKRVEPSTRGESPANVVVLAHGEKDGTVVWNEGERVAYSRLLGALPRTGIASVTIDSCYGELAIRHEMLENAPPGVLVQSRLGTAMSGSDGGRSTTEIAAQKNPTPLSILLELLDNVNPDQLVKDSHYWNNSGKYKDLNTDPNKVLPHTIGLGGHPPLVIDLNVKMQDLSDKGKGRTLDTVAFAKATDEVKKHFDPEHFNLSKKSQLNAKIDVVADKIKNGADTTQFSLEEKRISYALTAAHLYMSGEMNHLVDKAVDKAKADTTHLIATFDTNRDGVLDTNEKKLLLAEIGKNERLRKELGLSPETEKAIATMKGMLQGVSSATPLANINAGQLVPAQVASGDGPKDNGRC